MPRVHGDGFIHIDDVNFIIAHDAPLLEIQRAFSEEKTLSLQRIGIYVSQLIQDGDTLQVGYGSIPNAIMAHLYNKKNLGIHTELLTEGIVNLMKAGVIDNSKKTLNRGKTVATFCMAKKETYEYIHDNPSIVFRTVDYTNNPMLIARNDNIVAINTALEIDLTGQATSESIGSMFYSGIGGFHDFMRGALLARNGKTILAMKSTAVNESISRIVPALSAQAGVTLCRADVRYVVTEHGIAYLHGKNIRERAMALISIAHPKFRPMLIEEAKKRGLIYQDQAYIPGERGKYPETLETYRTTKLGFHLFLRPVKITDEPLLKDFFYSLSDKSLHRRFMSWRKDIPHERLQDFVIIDYTKEISILAITGSQENETILGLGQYGVDEATHTAEVAVAVRDDYQGRGIGSELLSYLTYLAKREGLLGFTAEVLVENRPMLQVFEQGGFDITSHAESGVYHLKMAFKTPETRREL
jgi:GNAT superfamily N-acetyltransferase